MAWLVFTVFGTGAAATRQQGELSFAVLSALKQGLEVEGAAPVQILLFCDAANQRSDLPVHHLIHDTDPGLCGGLRMVADHLAAPFVMVATASVFKSPPARLFDGLTDRPLVQSETGLLSSQAGYETFVDHIIAHSGTRPAADAPAYDLGVLGLDPSRGYFSFLNKNNSSIGINTSERSNFEHFDLIQRIASLGRPDVADALVTLYTGRRHPIRHVYHGMQRSMFPAGQPVNCALASRLPEVKMPPSPFGLRLRAKLGAMRRGFGLGTTAGYHAYLCAFAAPTDEGRDVWANIALDHLETSLTPRDRLARALPRLAQDALDAAKLRPDTTARWLAFWRG